MRSLVCYVATSIDGFIAGPDGSFDAFANDPETLAVLFARYPETCPAHVRPHLGITAQPARFDAVVMGANTHRPALDARLTSAYPHLQQYVVTHGELPQDPTVTRVDGDPVSFVADLKCQEGRDIWLCGGGDLAGQLIDEIDELQVKVNPVLLGEGIPLARLAPAPRTFDLVDSQVLPAGVVLTTYRRSSRG